MVNKCPKCGYEYDDGDIYCSQCGYKLVANEAPDLSPKLGIFEESKNFLFDNLKEIVESKTITDKIPPSKHPMFENIAFNLALSMVIVSIILMAVVYVVMGKQNSHKHSLHYKSLISNPARIPELKEPQTYEELIKNLFDVENFLLMYLENSDNSIDKKEQIFGSFLNEMDKLPHITNENVLLDKTHPCYDINNSKMAQLCVNKLNKDFKKTGVRAYPYYNIVYLYPDYKFIKNKYSKFLSPAYRKYVNLNSKYNIPVSVGVNMYIEPKRLADKIYDFEKLHNSVDNLYVKEKSEYILYDNFRKFIFTPSIYDTTTHEMENVFRNAYIYFIRSKKKSALYPTMLSYMDKKRAYSEENFKNDYPYKIFELTFEENVKNNVFNDVFAQLRKNIFSDNSEYMFAYIYEVTSGSWKKYNPSFKIGQNDFVLSEPDENQNIVIYNNTFAPSQELNISKYGKLYLINNALYVFNSDKLQLSKVLFNGRTFSLRNLSTNDITSVFPGIDVINIDSYSNYNIYIEKPNKKTNYIILSRYSQGYSQYVVSPVKGQIKELILPNMFAIDSTGDVVVAFHAKDMTTEGIAENSPTYKFTIHTFGYAPSDDENEQKYAQYDQKTAEDEAGDEKAYKPNIMPKLNDEKKQVKEDEFLKPAPAQILEPPNDND